MSITIAAMRERVASERRVAITPETAKKLQARGLRVLLEPNAGIAAGFPDHAYTDVEWASAEALATQADILCCVQPPPEAILSTLHSGAILVGQLRPYESHERLELMARQGTTAFALERLPRITRAQAMDVLSSQAAVAGYRAVVLAAEAAPRLFPMLTTAAGTLRPSRVLVIGAGVAGLQAIATARRLGAQVEGFDVRPETREQVQSLGAKFLDLGVLASGSGGYARELSKDERARQQQALSEHLRNVDVLITTAAVPGRSAPRIITSAMVEGMKTGAVIVDLAAESGGNCEPVQPGERIEYHGVTILGPLNAAADAPLHASEMIARNFAHFVELLLDTEGALALDLDDELLAQSCVVHAGEVRFKP